MMRPEEKDDDELIEIHDEDEDGPDGPPTRRTDGFYDKLVRSERPTVPPPAQSHIRDLLGGVVVEEDEDEAARG